jgi:hypothetical protein
MLRRILYGLIVLVLAAAGSAYLLPETVTITRSIETSAPPSKVYAIVSSFKRGHEWSPWAAKDPKMQQTFSGPEQGVGATFAWQSDNPEVGSGSQEIVVAEPDKRVETHLEMDGMGRMKSAFVLEPSGTGTRITWSFVSAPAADPVSRWFSLFLDGLVGPDFERGLANLKALAERP